MILKAEINFKENLDTYFENLGFEKIMVKEVSNNSDEMYYGEIPLIFQNKKRNILMKLKKNSDSIDIEIFNKKIVQASKFKVSESEKKFKEYIRNFINDIFQVEQKNK